MSTTPVSTTRVDSAKLWDLPERRTPIGVAVSGEQSVSLFAPVTEALIATEPKPELIAAWDEERARLGQDSGRKQVQPPVCWDPDPAAAKQRAHEQFRWFGGWKVNAELPGTSGFAGATQFVTADEVAQAIPVRPGRRADRDECPDDLFEFASSQLLPALHEAHGGD